MALIKPGFWVQIPADTYKFIFCLIRTYDHVSKWLGVKGVKPPYAAAGRPAIKVNTVFYFFVKQKND
jgi:hypothetical protein